MAACLKNRGVEAGCVEMVFTNIIVYVVFYHTNNKSYELPLFCRHSRISPISGVYVNSFICMVATNNIFPSIVSNSHLLTACA